MRHTTTAHARVVVAALVLTIPAGCGNRGEHHIAAGSAPTSAGPTTDPSAVVGSIPPTIAGTTAASETAPPASNGTAHTAKASAVGAVPPARFDGPGGRIVYAKRICAWWEACEDGPLTMLPSASAEPERWPVIGNLPAWSRDGSMVAFQRRVDTSCTGLSVETQIPCTAVFVIGADGRGERHVLDSAGQPSFSPDGNRLAMVRPAVCTYGPCTDVVASDRDGGHLVTLAHGASDPAWSPDGRHIAFTRVGDVLSADLWVMDSDGSSPKRLTASGADTIYRPAWSPDGARIAFGTLTCGQPHGRCSLARANFNTAVMNADGSDLRRLGVPTTSVSWSRDGTWLVLERDNCEGSCPPPDAMLVRSDGSNAANITVMRDSAAGAVFAPS